MASEKYKQEWCLHQKAHCSGDKNSGTIFAVLHYQSWPFTNGATISMLYSFHQTLLGHEKQFELKFSKEWVANKSYVFFFACRSWA